MLALIAGTGALPHEIVSRLDQAPVICAMAGSEPDRVAAEIVFRLEHLGSFLNTLKERGVTGICMAGAVQRPAFDAAALDAATLPLVPHLQKALTTGDDSALRTFMTLFEAQGFTVHAAQDITPDLLMPAGVPTAKQPDDVDQADVARAEQVLAAMDAADTGQACVVRKGQVLGLETVYGTDWMLNGLRARPDMGQGGVLFKAPKPGQDLRTDMPTIGPETVANAAAAGLHGMVLRAGQVIILDREQVIAACDEAGLFLWLREG